MNTSVNKSDSAPAKKRGPYKKYAHYGSVSKVPKTTQIDWKLRRSALSIGGKRKNLSPVAAPQSDDETSSDDDEHDEQGCGSTNIVNCSLKIVNLRERVHKKNRKTNPIDYYKELDTSFRSILNDDDSSHSKVDEIGFKRSDSPSTSELVTLQDGSPTNPMDEILDDANPAESYTSAFLIETLLIFATKLRHNLTYKAAEDIVRLLRVMGGTSLPDANKYYWKKIMNDFSTCLAVHYICTECGLYVGTGSEREIQCENCGNILDPKKIDLKSKNAFLYIPLTYQLKQIFQLTTAHDMCQQKRRKQCKSAIEDIMDGELYKHRVANDMISINFSVDGFPVFESSNFSSHPVLCTINEMTPRERKNHVLLCGLWFGSGKPDMMEYLKPFVAEAKTLFNDGFTYQYKGITYTKKMRVIAGICDSVARPTLRHSMQFNGKYGCGLCLHPGEVVAKGRGITRVYSLGPDDNPFGEGLRTHEHTLEHAEGRVKGIKGRSVLCDIPDFDIISSLNVDWMHCVALGCCRQFGNLWFDSSNHEEEFYFGNFIGDIDELLLSYTPTTEVSRTPRKMSDRVHWKAHEWVVFLLFYSLPTLSAFFPAKYVKHWSLLVDGIQILLKTSIMRSEIVFSHRSLIQFISGVEQLYGKRFVSFNVHLLSHLPQSVEQLGPLWTHSAFIYENENQVLLNYIKSSYGVAFQICDAIRTKCVVHLLSDICKDEMTDVQKKYLDKILSKSVKPKPSLVLEDACMVGTPTTHESLNRLHFLAFESANVPIDLQTTILSYKRALVHGEIIHSEAYTLVEKRCNYYVRLINGEIFKIALFYVVNIDQKGCGYALGNYLKKKNEPMIKDRRLEHLILLEKCNDNFSVVGISMIKEKVTMLHVGHKQYSIASVHPNHFELLI